MSVGQGNGLFSHFSLGRAHPDIAVPLLTLSLKRYKKYWLHRRRLDIGPLDS